jgi:2-dehydro-3-deoxyphosphogluconate aldolase / (4S)-4-hydroxy-2-oxoglutarate aldolase
MDVLERIGKAGLVPVVVINSAAEAVKAAQALLAAGLDVMEITLRTAAGLEAIQAVRSQYPEMLVGAGTVLNLDQCQAAVRAGAAFIVSPGFDPEIVRWCGEHQIAAVPGCVTPTEITAALKAGLHVLKFFPANVFGGVKAMKNLQAPFQSAGLSFIPTGGVGNDNLVEYADKSFIHAIGGGWLCNPDDIRQGDYAAITRTASAAIDILLGFTVEHIGLNEDSADAARAVGQDLSQAFGFAYSENPNSIYASDQIEVLRQSFLGRHGHIGVRTANIERALYYLEKRGYFVDPATARFQAGQMVFVYLKKEIGGFAIHLMQK